MEIIFSEEVLYINNVLYRRRCNALKDGIWFHMDLTPVDQGSAYLLEEHYKSKIGNAKRRRQKNRSRKMG